jgi:hypothetical protein
MTLGNSAEDAVNVRADAISVSAAARNAVIVGVVRWSTTRRVPACPIVTVLSVVMSRLPLQASSNLCDAVGTRLWRSTDAAGMERDGDFLIR